MLSEEYMTEIEENVSESDGETVEDVSDTEEEYSLESDMEELSAECPELLSSMKNTNPERYAELRSLGLSAKEAYLATGEYKKPHDTRGHLGDSVPKAARAPACKISRRELEIARSVFSGMSDEQIKKLYNKVKS